MSKCLVLNFIYRPQIVQKWLLSNKSIIVIFPRWVSFFKQIVCGQYEFLRRKSAGPCSFQPPSPGLLLSIQVLHPSKVMAGCKSPCRTFVQCTGCCSVHWGCSVHWRISWVCSVHWRISWVCSVHWEISVLVWNVPMHWWYPRPTHTQIKISFQCIDDIPHLPMHQLYLSTN